MTPGRPEPVAGRSGIVIVAIMKDEAHYIQDWIRFHLLAGVRTFILYDDGSKDGSADLARGISGASITVIPWQMTVTVEQPTVALSRQVLAYCHAIENFGGAFRWMTFLDIDEFIVPKIDRTIMEALGSLDSYTNISLPWTMFGTNGHLDRPDIPAPYAFTRRSADRPRPLLEFKCIVDPTEVTQVRVHRLRTVSMGKTSANDIGFVASYKERGTAKFLSDARLQLNHYYTRSQADLDAKMSKGGVSGFPLTHRANAVLDKVAHIDRTTIQDRAAIDFIERHGITNPAEFIKIGAS